MPERTEMDWELEAWVAWELVKSGSSGKREERLPPSSERVSWILVSFVWREW